MIRTIIAAALFALTLAAPASAKDTPFLNLVEAGPDTALIINGTPVQVVYLDDYARLLAGEDCRHFEDGSISCE